MLCSTKDKASNNNSDLEHNEDHVVFSSKAKHSIVMINYCVIIMNRKE